MSAASLRICNWNIDRSGVRGRWRSAHQASQIAAQQVDVAVVTEVHDTLVIEGLKPVSFTVDGLPPYQRFEHAVGIWSRLLVLGIVPVRTPRLATSVVLDSPLGALVVYGTILPVSARSAHRHVIVKQNGVQRGFSERLRPTCMEHHPKASFVQRLTLECT